MKLMMPTLLNLIVKVKEFGQVILVEITMTMALEFHTVDMEMYISLAQRFQI